MKSANKNISLSEAAGILQVSKATVSNWLRSEMIRKNDKGILSESVQEVKKKIESGELRKLNVRANKTFSSKKFHPSELEDAQNIKADVSYQASKTSGVKSKEGSFYTPDFLIDEIIYDHNPGSGSKICDPCCGTGRFLKNIAGRSGNDLLLYGFDTDETAVKIALHDIKVSGFSHINIKHFDSLINPENEKYDFIFTNPPWGAHYSAEYLNLLRKLYHDAGSEDSLEYFLRYAYRSIRHGGVISFILPESFLYVKKFKTIRKFLLDNSTVLKIKNYGRIFSNVFTPVIRIDIRKILPEINHKIIADGSLIFQSDFNGEKDNIYNVAISEADKNKLRLIFGKPHITLKNNADWSLGIVTGDNKRFLRNTQENDFTKQVITGKNIEPYIIKQGRKFLYRDFSKFQQVSKTDYFSVKEKLIYKFISDRLVFAYDDSGVCTLNSANIMIPKLRNYPIKTVMAILNSDLMNFIYMKKFNSLKVLRSNIETLPFPENPDRKIINLIEDKTNRIINNEGVKECNRRELEGLVNKLYGVNNESTNSDPEEKIISRT